MKFLARLWQNTICFHFMKKVEFVKPEMTKTRNLLRNNPDNLVSWYTFFRERPFFGDLN